jgi:hypothetical protein
MRIMKIHQDRKTGSMAAEHQRLVDLYTAPQPPPPGVSIQS